MFKKKEDIGDKMTYEGNYLKLIHISIINEKKLQNKYDIEDPKGKTCTSKCIHRHGLTSLHKQRWQTHEHYPSVDDDSKLTSFGSEFKSSSCICNKSMDYI